MHWIFLSVLAICVAILAMVSDTDDLKQRVCLLEGREVTRTYVLGFILNYGCTDKAKETK